MTILTSWHMLVGRAKITPGQTVLVMGGGSGVGSFAIQIAKLYNCDVIAVGEDVKGFKVGDRVVSHSNLACRVCSACTSGREFDCTRRQVWGFQTGPLWGAYSEEVHLPEVNVSHIPEEYHMKMQQQHP